MEALMLGSQYGRVSSLSSEPPAERVRGTSRLLACIALVAILLAPSRGIAQTLGSAQTFSIVAGSAATAAGTGSLVTGDVGVSPQTSLTGFDGTSATIVPPFSAHVNDGPAIAAQSSVGGLYTFLAGSGPCSPLATQLDGVSVGPGVYCFSTTADLAATGNLTLDGAGIYIFQVGSSLTANVLSTVTLLNGADPCEVYWQVTSSATLNGATFVGNVVAQAGVSLGSDASLTGRALATTAGAVTLAGGNTIAGCTIAATPTPGPTPTPVSSPTSTPVSSPTSTPVSSPTSTPVSSPTSTPVPTLGPTPMPTLAPDGGPCIDPSQCQSGNCASGVCCDQPCTGPDESCDGGMCKEVVPAVAGATGRTLFFVFLTIVAFAAWQLRHRTGPR